jgi:hypothetical protein
MTVAAGARRGSSTVQEQAGQQRDEKVTSQAEPLGSWAELRTWGCGLHPEPGSGQQGGQAGTWQLRVPQARAREVWQTAVSGEMAHGYVVQQYPARHQEGGHGSSSFYLQRRPCCRGPGGGCHAPQCSVVLVKQQESYAYLIKWSPSSHGPTAMAIGAG